MQISGANLLLASQQVPAAVQPAAPGFTQALHKTSGFVPRDLTRPEPAPAPQADDKPAPSPAGPTRPGMHIDIKI